MKTSIVSFGYFRASLQGWMRDRTREGNNRVLHDHHREEIDSILSAFFAGTRSMIEAINDNDEAIKRLETAAHSSRTRQLENDSLANYARTTTLEGDHAATRGYLEMVAKTQIGLINDLEMMRQELKTQRGIIEHLAANLRTSDIRITGELNALHAMVTTDNESDDQWIS